MGFAWYEKGMMIEAINVYKAAVDLDTHALRLAQLYECSNQRNQVIHWCLRVVQQEAGFPGVLDRVKKLQNN